MHSSLLKKYATKMVNKNFYGHVSISSRGFGDVKTEIDKIIEEVKNNIETIEAILDDVAIIKVKVKSVPVVVKARKLKATWTLECAEDLKKMHGV